MENATKIVNLEAVQRKFEWIQKFQNEKTAQLFMIIESGDGSTRKLVVFEQLAWVSLNGIQKRINYYAEHSEEWRVKAFQFLYKETEDEWWFIEITDVDTTSIDRIIKAVYDKEEYHECVLTKEESEGIQGMDDLVNFVYNSDGSRWKDIKSCLPKAYRK